MTTASKFAILLSISLTFISFMTTSQTPAKPDIKGRWDITMTVDGKEQPSWLEITKSGHETMIGRFVYAFGSARPISEIKESDGSYHFSIPRQWEPEGQDMVFTFMPDGDGLKGSMIYTDGQQYDWTAVRQPKREYTANPTWGEPIQLFNASDLSGWIHDDNTQWRAQDGILINPKSGVNLITEQKFDDFKLHIEFRCPKGGNSGVYLRGRYEVQVQDDHGLDPSPVHFGGIYGFLTPNEMAAKPHGEWQTFDITLIANRVTVEANGKSIISDQIIPGITGGALDSNEGAPGPILLQGDHGPIEYRNIVLTPRIE